MVDAIKTVLEVIGGIVGVVIIALVIVVCVVQNDIDHGNNPFQ